MAISFKIKRTPAAERIINIRARIHRDEIPGETPNTPGDRVKTFFGKVKHAASERILDARHAIDSLTPEQKALIGKVVVTAIEVGLILSAKDQRTRHRIMGGIYAGHAMHETFVKKNHYSGLFYSVSSLIYTHKSTKG